MEVGACAERARTDREGGRGKSTRRRERGPTAGRKLGGQAKMGEGKRGVPRREAGTPGRKKGRGRGAAGVAGSFPLVRAGCRETRGPMSAHQLSPAPAACPYMVRPLGGRSRTSPYKGRNLNTGYTLFSARPAAAPAIDERAAERAAARGPRERVGRGPRRLRGRARCDRRSGRPGRLRGSEGVTRRRQALRCFPPPPCFQGANANEPGLKSNCFCFKK